MNIYFIYYTTNPRSTNSNQIDVKTIKCRETPQNYCWPGTRLSKIKTNIIHSHVSHSSSISLYVYSTSLDILDTFKTQVQSALLQNIKIIQQQLTLSNHNLQTFIDNYQDQNINQTVPFEEEFEWYPQSCVD